MKNIKLNRWLILAFVLAIAVPIFAITPEELADLYNRGNEAYRDKDFATAIKEYTAAIDSGGVSAELFYNLGNAYFRAGSLANAILWFERARILAPTDDDINNNLQFVQKLTQDKIESLYRGLLIVWFIKLIESISFDKYWWILLIVSLLATGATIYKIFQLKGKWLAIILWIIFLVLLAGWYFKGNRIWERNLAVVMFPKVDVRSAPEQDSEILFTIHDGTILGIKECRRNWYRIVLADGHTGWLPAKSVEKVFSEKIKRK